MKSDNAHEANPAGAADVAIGAADDSRNTPPTQPPPALRVLAVNIPAELRALPRWVCWKPILSDKGKWTKLPLSVSGGAASSTDPTTWATFEHAIGHHKQRGCVGVMYALGEGIAGIDLDDCRDPATGMIEPWAQTIIDSMNTCAEVSPSGTGIKLVLRGAMPEGKGRRKKLHGGEIEIYSQGRFWTFTGHRLPGTPTTIEDRQAELDALLAEMFPPEPIQTPRHVEPVCDDDRTIIERAMKASNGHRFRRLWEGDTSDYAGDTSRADVALCAMIAFYTGPNPDRIERIFSQSALGARDKWANRPDYRKCTIGAALKNKADFYGHGADRNGRASTAAPTPKAPAPPRPPVPKWRPFPVELLPEPIARFATETADAMGCDVSFVAAPALVASMACIGAARSISPKPSWPGEPCVAWLCVVAPSGTLKSPAVDAALRPVRDIQRLALDEYDDRLKEYEHDRKVYSRALKKYETGRDDSDLPPVEPERPACYRIIVNDTTIEALVPILKSNPRGVLVDRDELAGWLGSFAKYRSRGAGDDEPAWLTLHRAGLLIVDRKTSGTLSVPTAAASVLGTSQPSIIREALEGRRTASGLAARLLIISPPVWPKRWSKRYPPRSVVEGYATIIAKLAALPMGVGEHGPEPIELTLSADAEAAWVAWYNLHATRQDEAEDDAIKARLAKLEAYALRFSLLIALVDDSAAVSVGADAIRRGTALATWFADEAERAEATFAEDPEDRDLRMTAAVVERLGGSATVRDLMRRGGRRFNTAEAAELGLMNLVRAGWGRWQPSPPGVGRPVDTFILNPPGDADTTPPESPPDADTIHENAEENPDCVSVNTVNDSGVDPEADGPEVLRI